MSNQSVGNRVQKELSQAVASGRLPANVQKRAKQLLARIETPVRLGLMGMPGSGKSTLLNLLVGSDVLPEGAKLPTLQLTYGETEQAICTLSDGSKTTLPTADAQQISELAPAFVEIEMPLPALAKISVLEVVTPDDPTSIHRASQWAAKRSDVALWCTQGFNPTEQSIWAQMPDIIKDHAFLMVTKADFLHKNGMMDATIAAIRAVANDEFNQILPIATIDAIAARQPDGSVNKSKMRESGGLALISAVLKQVEMGRQSAVDMADILLHQHADDLAPEAAADEPTANPAKEGVSDTQTAESAEIPVNQIETAIEDTVAETETPTPTGDAAEPHDPEPIEAEQESNVVTLHPTTRDAYEQAVGYIVTQSRALIEAAENMGDTAPSEIIAKAVEHVQWVSDHLNEHGDDADPLLMRARDAALDAADLVQLMQMEKRDSAAVEALSLMLQIKRELQADLAA